MNSEIVATLEILVNLDASSASRDSLKKALMATKQTSEVHSNLHSGRKVVVLVDITRVGDWQNIRIK